MLCKVEHVQAGMLVDLEGDRYADPQSDNHVFPYELQHVAFQRQETPDCIVIGFDGWDWCGFPPDHRLNIKRVIKDDFGMEF